MDKVAQYLYKNIPERSEFFQSLEEYALANRVPIMEPDSMNFLTQLVRIKQPKHILELGTAIGYSALRMLEANPMATITTIERNEEMYQVATDNIQKEDKLSQINVLFGDAIEAVQQLVHEQKRFDFIFIDAAKGQYKRFFMEVESLLNDHGIIVCDNILFKGYVADETKDENVRVQKLATKLRVFNDWLVQQPDYHTSIIPIGDGLSISVKLK